MQILEGLIKYPAVVLIGFAVTYGLTPLVTRLAVKWGVVDRPDSRRIHAHPTPRGGGLAVFIGFHAACAALFFAGPDSAFITGQILRPDGGLSSVRVF